MYEWESFGLPNVLLLWTYDYRKWGQLGYCEFKHRELKVLFRTEPALDEFSAVWREVFGKTPDWTDEAALTV